MPVLAFADSAKALVANAANDLGRVRTLWHASMIITAGMMVVWVAVVPAFKGAAGVLTHDAETVKWAVTAFGILFVPYVLFSFNTVMDSVFYGIGLTKYLAYQSILTNGSVYLIAFLLYLSGAWEVSFEGVMVLFSLGILVDSFLTLFFLVKALYVDPARRPRRGWWVHPYSRRFFTCKQPLIRNYGPPTRAPVTAEREEWPRPIGGILSSAEARVESGRFVNRPLSTSRLEAVGCSWVGVQYLADDSRSDGALLLEDAQRLDLR